LCSTCLFYNSLHGFDSVTVVRDLDGYIYFRENEGSLLAGGFEPKAKPAFEDGTIPG
jgi:pyruvate dehydrogenase phosphatase regulatory subunit